MSDIVWCTRCARPDDECTCDEDARCSECGEYSEHCVCDVSERLKTRVDEWLGAMAKQVAR